MTDTRIMVCPECTGDGGFEMLSHYCDHNTGAPMTWWQTCHLCEGKREIEIEVSPIEMADLEEVPNG